MAERKILSSFYDKSYVKAGLDLLKETSFAFINICY